MLFNSIIFITVFLPIALLGWFLLQRLENPIYAKLFIVGMSFWFYGYYNLIYLWILLASIFFNFVFSILMEHTGKPGMRKLLLAVGLLGNIGMLFYFKYFNFFVDNCNYLLHTDIHLEKIALPLGISFFTFQERKNRRPSADQFFDGFALFILGLAKKVLLADSLAVLVNAEYNNIAALDSPSAWIVICFYMMELYFDFSGYCDMARGIGKLFGFRLPENFNSPFKAVSVKDFWRRWHMTLSRFLADYIYIPLGGNRRGKARQCLNLFVVFLVSGLWHGANWTFVVWGLMHGLAEIFETLFPKLRFKWEWMNRLITVVFVTLSFSVFRSTSLSEAALLWKRLFAGGNKGFFIAMCNTLRFPENYAVIKFLEMYLPQLLNAFFVMTFCLLAGIGIGLLQGRKAEEWIQDRGTSRLGLFCMATLFTWAFLSLSQVSVFLYFNF